MADPFTAGMAAIGMATSAAGGILSAQGASSEGAANATMYKYKAGIARMNAQINRQNSDYTLDAGEAAAVRSGLSTRFTIAKQKTAQAANGFDVNTGSNADVRESTRDLGVVDQNTIRTNAGRKALGHRNAAAGLDAEAAMDDVASSNAQKSGQMKALGTLIGTAGSVASKWGQASETFGGGTSRIKLWGPSQEFQGYA